MENNFTIPGKYMLRLFITGASPNSTLAINNIKAICEKYLQGNYELEIVDIYQQPAVAKNEQIVALPLLIKSSPPPVKKFIGNMSDTKMVLSGLELENNNEE